MVNFPLFFKYRETYWDTLTTFILLHLRSKQTKKKTFQNVMFLANKKRWNKKLSWYDLYFGHFGHTYQPKCIQNVKILPKCDTNDR